MSDGAKILACLLVVAFGTALLMHRAKRPAPKPVQVNAVSELNGCPRVGGEYTHDGQWLTCYACAGETPVCLLIGGAR